MKHQIEYDEGCDRGMDADKYMAVETRTWEGRLRFGLGVASARYGVSVKGFE